MKQRNPPDPKPDPSLLVPLCEGERRPLPPKPCRVEYPIGLPGICDLIRMVAA
jgi:hypothetical protein